MTNFIKLHDGDRPVYFNADNINCMERFKTASGDKTRLNIIYEPDMFWVNETPEEIIKLAKGE